MRWLSPLPLWTGILAGPIAWALDLVASYALVKWVCHTSNYARAAAHYRGSAGLGRRAARRCRGPRCTRTANDVPTDGGQPRQRARFMAILGLASCALFALQILAGAIPHWVLDACQ